MLTPMTQFSHLARSEKNRERRAFCFSASRLNWVTIKHTTKSGRTNCKEFSRGQATVGTTGPRIATHMVKESVSLWWQDLRTNWRTPMLNAMSRADLTDELGLSPTPEVGTGCASDKDLQRADGCCRVVLSGSEIGTRIDDIYERSPIRVMFPRTGHRPVEEAVLINTSGGIAGGDRLKCSVTALPGASLAVTSQAAEKVYRALCEPARIATRLRVLGSAKLAWLPQETIVFNGARLHRSTEIELSSGAELLALESLVLGRAAYGETLVTGSLTDSWRVRQDGRLIWADNFRIASEVFAQLHRKALLANCNALATLIYFGATLHKRLELLREIIPSLGCPCGATLLGGVIVVRLAAKESFDLKLALRSLLLQFGPELGASPFCVPKLWSC